MASILGAKPLSSRPSRPARWSTDSWAWEILSCTISIIATIIVAIVVFIYDEKSLPRMPYSIGLNSIISIIGTVAKSALLLTITSCISQYKWVNFADAFKNRSLQDLQLHDEASRGPWGSFMLLVNRKGSYWVKLGALATVFSMAFDPFYQAIIRIEQRPKYQNDPGAFVKRALSFDGTNYHTGGNDGFFSKDWFRGIVNAVTSETVILETSPSCPTGNCTFPIFSSLAFCSNCLNITQFLQRNSICDPYPNTTFCTFEIPLANSSHSYDQPPKNSIIHSDLNFLVFWSNDQPEPLEDPFGGPSFQSSFADYRGSTAPREFHLSGGEIIPNSFATVALVKFAPWTVFAHPGLLSTAHICALSTCAREYNTSMTSGLLQTQIVSTSYSKLTRFDKPYDASIGNSSYTFTFPNNINHFTLVTNTSDEWLYGNIRDFSFEEALSSSLRDLLDGSFASVTSGSGTNSNIDSNMLLSGFNLSTNIPKTMDRVAAAMTNRLRDMSNLTVQGQSGSMELYIRVSWWWLLLPILTVIFGTILLVSVMIMTRKHKLPIWKTSELALLFHGLDLSPLGSDSVKMLKASEMENIASTLQVGFGRDSERGVLKLERKLEQVE